MLRLALVLLTALTAAANAQEEEGRMTIGGDVFVGGRSPVLSQAAPDDVFAAGETVQMLAGAGGSVHAAGRRLELDGPIGGDIYAAGYEVRLTGSPAGDATLAGYEVEISGDVGGDLRAAGSQVAVLAPVAGYAMLSGESVRIASQVAGDVRLAARDISFEDGASVGGDLTIFHPDPESVVVPDFVAPASRVTVRPIEESDVQTTDFARELSPGWRGVLMGLAGSVVVVALITTLLAAIAPDLMAALRRVALDRPFRTIWFGFLTLSVLTGAAFVLVLTLIGILISPAAIVIAILLGFAGYIIGVYVFGVGLIMSFGAHEPYGLGGRALAAFVGALFAALIALIPFVGWLFGLALALLGAGALVVRLLRPSFLERPA